MDGGDHVRVQTTSFIENGHFGAADFDLHIEEVRLHLETITLHDVTGEIKVDGARGADFQGQHGRRGTVIGKLGRFLGALGLEDLGDGHLDLVDPLLVGSPLAGFFIRGDLCLRLEIGLNFDLHADPVVLLAAELNGVKVDGAYGDRALTSGGVRLGRLGANKGQGQAKSH